MLECNRGLTPVVGLLLLAGACAPAAPGFTEADRAEIQATTDAAVAIVNGSKDWEQFAATYYAPDAILMPPNHGAVEGRAGIAEFFAGFPPIESLRFEPVEAHGVGDVAYVYGHYTLSMMPPGAESAVTDYGKYIEVWRRQEDGSWKLSRDIFNSDVPLPEG